MIDGKISRRIRANAIKKLIRRSNRISSWLVSSRLKSYFRLDDLVSKEYKGQYIQPGMDSVRYNVKLLDAYCKQKNKRPETLTPDELKQFVIRVK